MPIIAATLRSVAPDGSGPASPSCRRQRHGRRLVRVVGVVDHAGFDRGHRQRLRPGLATTITGNDDPNDSCPSRVDALTRDRACAGDNRHHGPAGWPGVAKQGVRALDGLERALLQRRSHRV